MLKHADGTACTVARQGARSEHQAVCCKVEESSATAPRLMLIDDGSSKYDAKS